jgi:DNA-binding beta-propeller fold protein YncE
MMSARIIKNGQINLFATMVAVLGCLLCGCGTVATVNGVRDDATQVKPVWPPPPAEARIRFEKSLNGVEAMGVRLSVWRRLINLITSADTGRELFIKPQCVSIDDQDNLCIVDSGARRVFFFDRASRRCRQWSRIGGIDLESPVAVAKEGNTIYVADTKLGKVLAFSPKGKLKFEITEKLAWPSGLAICGDRLAVSDARRHRISFFDLDGTFLYWFGDRGTEPGMLNYPTHVAADASGNLYVTDSMNFRIQVFTDVGKLLGVIGEAGNVSGTFSRPKGIALDSQSNIFVVDAIFDNVQLFSTTGQFLMSFGSAGQEAGKFWMPSGIAVDRNQKVYVADSYNKRIQVFEVLTGGVSPDAP